MHAQAAGKLALSAIEGCMGLSLVAVQTLVEEGHIPSHLIHIWQLIVRHADLYYPSR